MSMQTPRTVIEDALIQQGIERFGFTLLRRPLSFDFYEEWVKAGMHGDMDYLQRHIPQKADAQKLLPKAQSAIVVAFPYYPHPFPSERPEARIQHAHIALYARGQDYHNWLKQKLEDVISLLTAAFPEEVFRSFVDSGPVLERDLAYRAGLGWVGKNTCLIDRKRGSLFFIGEIYTSLILESNHSLSGDHCGTCNRCLEACPTQALVAPRKLDARKCISYLTIESKEVPPEPLRKQMQDWLFGCDICQTVCPWNLKIHRELKSSDQDPLPPDLDHRASLIEDLRSLLQAPDVDLKKRFVGTALARAAGFKIRRNAIIVAANNGLEELIEPIEKLTSDQKLGELAAWALLHLQNTASH